MGNLPLTFLPPQNWQDFEKFLKGLVDVIWKQESWDIYGRPGQAQLGIDLYGYDEQRRFTGIQCKKKNQTDATGKLLTNSLLTKKLIEEEISSAESIQNPNLERLIFATTSSRDTKIQDIIRAISHERKKTGKFIVDIWFWEDFQIYIEKHIELMNWYYSDFLENIHKYDKNIHFLTMLRQAFTRPAYRTAISQEESGGNFIQAIKNTMEAITSGKLYNRRGELLTTSIDYKKVTNDNWRNSIWEIYNKLDEIRKIYQQGLINKAIREHHSCIEILDHRLTDKFNKLRADCLQKMNEILVQVNLELIKSELIRH